MDLSGIFEFRGQEVVGEAKHPKKVCAVCQAPADKSCGACHQIDYCSAEHQKSHWKVHKKDCSPIRIVTSPELGPYFVITRDIPPGTLLITELPVLVNPYKSADDFKSCISCRLILPSRQWTCSKCSTPFFCSQSCSMNKIHSEVECSILSKCSAKQKEKICNTPNMMVMYLRALHLKNTDPQTWAKVLDIRGADQPKPGDLDENDKWFIRKILPLLGEMGVGYEEDIAKLKGINQQIGIWEQSVISQNGGHGESDIIYLRASNFVQNCFPNCTPIIGKGPEFKLEIRTTLGIKKGAIPSIDYIRISNGIGVIYRQHKHFDFKGALCICPRCTDPTGTELGTMLSAVKCTEPNCNEGYLLPVDVKDMEENAPWRCNRSGCQGELTWKAINDMIQQLNTCVKNFILNVRLGDVNVKSTVGLLDSLKQFVHPNHWLVLSFQNQMIDKILPNMIEIGKKSQFSIPQIQMYISMIEDVLKMTELTAPGLSVVRALLWNNLLTLLVPKLAGIKFGQDPCDKEMEEGFKRRVIEAVGQLRLIAKFYPKTWPAQYNQILKIILPELQF